MDMMIAQLLDARLKGKGHMYFYVYFCIIGRGVMWLFPVGAPSSFVIFQLIHTEARDRGAFVLLGWAPPLSLKAKAQPST